MPGKVSLPGEGRPPDCQPRPLQRRDFAVILASLQQLGYAVEWRVVNAADYGYAQHRRRTFIVGYHESTPAAGRAVKGLAADPGGSRPGSSGADERRRLAVTFSSTGPHPSGRMLCWGWVDTTLLEASFCRLASPSPGPGALPTFLMGNPLVVRIVRTLIETDGAT